MQNSINSTFNKKAIDKVKRAIIEEIESLTKDLELVDKEVEEDFEKIKWKENCKKPKVGIVGEILVKYHPIPYLHANHSHEK